MGRPGSKRSFLGTKRHQGECIKTEIEKETKHYQVRRPQLTRRRSTQVNTSARINMQSTVFFLQGTCSICPVSCCSGQGANVYRYTVARPCFSGSLCLRQETHNDDMVGLSGDREIADPHLIISPSFHLDPSRIHSSAPAFDLVPEAGLLTSLISIFEGHARFSLLPS